MQQQQRHFAWAPFMGLAFAAILPLARAEAQCTPTLAAQQARLTKPVQGSNDYVGRDVAIDGDWAVVGVHGFAANDVGAVEVWQRMGATWSHHSHLTASNPSSSDVFGFSVAIDGSRIVVGAYGANPGGASNAGSAYVFDLVAGVWTETAILTAPTPAAFDQFGIDVDVSGDTLVLGADLMDVAGFVDVGSAFVFTGSAGVWTLQAQLTPSVQQNNMWFGRGVAIEGDTVVVGAPGRDVVSNWNEGSAFVFQRSGNIWTGISDLTSPGGAGGDEFGHEVAIGGDRIVIGAYLADGAAGADEGKATVFSQQFGLWSFEQELKASTAAAGDRFGTGIAVDGQRILVGAWGVNALGSNSGAAYVFTFCGGFNPWTEQLRLTPLDPHGEDWFGFAVGLSGSTAICGAHGFNGLGTNVGAAYINELSRGEFTSYGFGDGNGTPCPCLNDSPAGLNQGCLNSSGRGGVLSAWGSDVAAANDLVFMAGNLISSAPALLFAGHTDLSGGSGLPFGDGLRVAGGSVRRLQVAVPDPDGNVIFGPFTGAQGGWASGQSRFFQVWYRDPIASPCLSGFNLTNGLQVDFQ